MTRPRGRGKPLPYGNCRQIDRLQAGGLLGWAEARDAGGRHPVLGLGAHPAHQLGPLTPALGGSPSQLGQRTLGHDPTLAHDRHLVGHQLRLAQDVRGHDQGGAAIPLLGQVGAHLGGGHGVEAGGRLVAEQPVRPVQGGTDQGHLLGHAPGEGGERTAALRQQVEPLQQLLDAPRALGLRHAVEVAEVVEVLDRGVAAVQAGLVGDDPQAPTHGVQVGRQPQLTEPDLTGVGVQDAAGAAQRRRLAGPVLAQQDQELTGLDLEVHAAHRQHAAERLLEAEDRNHRRKGRLSTWTLPSKRHVRLVSLNRSRQST